MKKQTKTDSAVELTRRLGVLRSRDARKHGIHPQHLCRLCKKGNLERIARGLYRLPDADTSEHATLATVSKRFPSGTICLLSALRFHGIGTQNPREVWMALRRRSATPRKNDLPIRFVVFSEESFDAGIEKHKLDNVPVQITSPAKTVADCFKYRNKVGLETAIEALREALRQRKCSADDIWRFAKVCRIANVIRPYMEAML